MVTSIVFTLSLQNGCWQCWERRGGQVRKGRAPSLAYAIQTNDPSFPLLLSNPSHCVEEDRKSLFWVSFLVSIWKDFTWPCANLTLEGIFWPVMKRQKPQEEEFFSCWSPSQSTEIQEHEYIVAKSWPPWLAMWSQKYNQHQEYLGRESFLSCC